MNPQYGVVGDDYGTQLPETQVDQTALTELKHRAKFSKSKEFQELKQHCLDRIDFYQQFLPDGRSVLTDVPKPEQWQAANIVIGEFKGLIAAYESAAEMLKDNG